MIQTIKIKDLHYQFEFADSSLAIQDTIDMIKGYPMVMKRIEQIGTDLVITCHDVVDWGMEVIITIPGGDIWEFVTIFQDEFY